MEKLEAYKENLKKFLKENYSTKVLRDLSKHFDLIYENPEDTESGREEMACRLVDTVFADNQAYAFFCVLKQFKKYYLKGVDFLIDQGKEFVPVPSEMIRPRFTCKNSPNSVGEEAAEEVKADTCSLRYPLRGDTIYRNFLKAIVIGVGQDIYGRENGSYCENDANAVASFLKEQYGLPEKNITLLTGYVSGKDAMAKLREFCRNSSPMDNILFYFSGYGMEKSGNSYLMTSDSYVHGHTIRNGLRVISVHEMIQSCKARVKLCIFDANCCGQRLEELPVSGTVLDEAVNEVIYNDGDRFDEKTYKTILKNGNGFITFAACDSSEKAYESEALQHGYFTWSLLQGLKYGLARRKNQNIYMEDLKIYTTRQVMEDLAGCNRRQTPQYQCELNGNIFMEYNLDERKYKYIGRVQ